MGLQDRDYMNRNDEDIPNGDKSNNNYENINYVQNNEPPKVDPKYKKDIVNNEPIKFDFTEKNEEFTSKNNNSNIKFYNKKYFLK